MSIQAGLWNFDGAPVGPEALLDISQSISECGPDDERTSEEGEVGMLYRPFHTTAESRLERQPYIVAGGRRITWDGRLDNRDELVPLLQDLLFGDHTDIAIVAAAFERWSTDCFAKLVGDWALAIWDRQAKQLILARDYIGVRQLFYYPTHGRIIWCSHLAPLTRLGERFTLCDQYIAGFLATYPDSDLTPYREIHSVPHGCFIKVTAAGTRTTHAYWSFSPRTDLRHKTDSEYEEHFRYLFRQAVRRRLRTDSPVLADLSGGLDSSSIVCMADDILANEGAETPVVDTFSIFDRREPEEEDFNYFVKVEERRGRTGNHVELLGTGDTISFSPPAFVAAPAFRGREEVKAAQQALIRERKFRVTLSGQGGDELLGQAMDPRVQMADLLVQFRFQQFARQLMAWSLLIRRPWIQLLYQTVLLLMPLAVRCRLTSTVTIDDWVDRNFARRHRMKLRLLQIVKTPWYWLPSDRDSAQTQAALAQQMTQRPPSNYEARYPYLDQNLAEFLLTIPREQLLRPGDRRSLMRRALKNILPDEILSRRTKSGAGRCFIATLEKHQRFLDQILAAPFAWQLGYIDKDRFHSALEATWTGHTITAPRFLEGLSLENWLRNIASHGVISVPRSSHQTAINTPLATSASGVVNSKKKGGEYNDLSEAESH